jgi:preprotein translocase subunit SecE
MEGLRDMDKSEYEVKSQSAKFKKNTYWQDIKEEYRNTVWKTNSPDIIQRVLISQNINILLVSFLAYS